MQAFHILIFAKFQNIPLLPVVLLIPFLIFFCHVSVVSYLESFDWRVDYVSSSSELEVRFNLWYYCFVTCFIFLKRLVIIIPSSWLLQYSANEHFVLRYHFTICMPSLYKNRYRWSTRIVSFDWKWSMKSHIWHLENYLQLDTCTPS